MTYDAEFSRIIYEEANVFVYFSRYFWGGRKQFCVNATRFSSECVSHVQSPNKIFIVMT